MSVSFPTGLSFAAGPGLPGRLLLIFREVVRARKPKSMGLRGAERELFKSPGRLLLLSGAVVRARKRKAMT